MHRAANAVLFDLDNTLADRDRAFAAWARWFVRERLGLADDVAIEEAVAALVVRDAGGHMAKEAIFRALKERHAGLTETVEALVEAFREQLLAHLPPLGADAARLLTALAEARIPWGIVSNGSRGSASCGGGRSRCRSGSATSPPRWPAGSARAPGR